MLNQEEAFVEDYMQDAMYVPPSDYTNPNLDHKTALNLTDDSHSEMKQAQSIIREKPDLSSLIPDLPEIDPYVIMWLMAPNEVCLDKGLPATKWDECEAQGLQNENNYHDLSNKHPLDEKVKYLDKPHVYFTDGSCKTSLSATTFIGAWFPPFDKEGQALRSYKGKTFKETVHRKSYKYHFCYETYRDENLTDEEKEKKCVELIMNSYSGGAEKGTELHKTLEIFLDKGGESCDDLNIPDYNASCFNQFMSVYQNKFWWTFQTLRLEWSVCEWEVDIPGQIDFAGIELTKNGELVLLDWKRTENISTFYNKYAPQSEWRGYSLCADMNNCNFNKYSLQLNLYKYILEKFYGVRVGNMLLLQFHPKLKQAIIHKVPNMQKTMIWMLAARLKYLRIMRQCLKEGIPLITQQQLKEAKPPYRRDVLLPRFLETMKAHNVNLN